MSSARKPSLPVRVATLTFAAGSLTVLVVQASVSAGCHRPGGAYVPPHVGPPEQVPAPVETLDEPAAAMPGESQEPAAATSSDRSAQALDAGDVLAPPAAYLPSTKDTAYGINGTPLSIEWSPAIRRPWQKHLQPRKER